MIWILLFVLGLIFGSFGSVLMTRLADGRSRETLMGILTGRSRDPESGQVLPRYDLIPLVSYLRLRGKSRSTGRPIPRYYPVLEIGSGLIFVASYALVIAQGGSWGLVTFVIATNRLLLLILVWDIVTLYLHTPLWQVLLVIGLGVQFFGAVGSYAIAVVMSLVFGAVFYAIRWGSQYYALRRFGAKSEIFGEGDAWLAFAIGALMPLVFGLQHLFFDKMAVAEVTVLYLLVSALVALVYSGLAALVRRSQHKPVLTLQGMVPFLPAMVIGYWILLVWGHSLMAVWFG